jgi:hypothetical protein
MSRPADSFGLSRVDRWALLGILTLQNAQFVWLAAFHCTASILLLFHPKNPSLLLAPRHPGAFGAFESRHKIPLSYFSYVRRLSARSL